MVAVGTGQQEACLGVGGPDHNPPLGPAIVGERRRIVDKFESKDTNEELDCRVVVVNDDGDQFQKRHRSSLPCAETCRSRAFPELSDISQTEWSER